MKRDWIKINALADGITTEINIDGPIGGGGWFEPDGVRASDIKAVLLEIGAIKGDCIIVNINSMGGDVNDGISIHDLLAQSKATKKVYINGMTASAATIIAMAGNEINMSENALFLVHRGSLCARGNVNDIKMAMADLEKVDALMCKVYAKRTGKSEDEIIAKMNVNNGNGEWLTADEALAFGFITAKFEPTAIAAFVDRSIIAEMKLPAIPEEKLNKINNNSNNNKSILNEMKKIMTTISAMFASAGIKFETPAPAAGTGIDIVTDKGTLHVETTEAAAKVGDIATIDGTPAPAGDYIETSTENVYTIGDAGVIDGIETAEEEQTEEMSDAAKAVIADLNKQLIASRNANSALQAQINVDKSAEKAITSNVEKLTKQYDVLAKSITSSGFTMPTEVTIFNKLEQPKGDAGKDAAERKKSYKPNQKK